MSYREFEKRSCPKCGSSQIDIRYHHEQDPWCFNHCQNTKEFDHDVEHMVHSCQACRYKWLTAPKGK